MFGVQVEIMGMTFTRYVWRLTGHKGLASGYNRRRFLLLLINDDSGVLFMDRWNCVRYGDVDQRQDQKISCCAYHDAVNNAEECLYI